MTTTAFLKLEPPPARTPIRGESRDRAHLGWIDLLSFDLAAAPPEGRGSRRPRQQDIASALCVKRVDGTSPRLSHASANGEAFPRAIVHLSGTPGVWFELRDVVISGVRISQSQGEQIESFTLVSSGVARHCGAPGMIPPPPPRPWPGAGDRQIGRHQGGFPAGHSSSRSKLA